MTQRSQKFFIILIVVAVLSWILTSEIFKRSPGLQKEAIDFIEKNISEPLMPEPLRSARKIQSAVLTVAGTLTATNQQRLNYGFPALSENNQSRTIAEYKMRDLFSRQYFAHYAPDGSSGVAELADKFDYKYIAIGENLALGGFENDALLVQAWMDSPGHRENILNENYTQIGIAVGKNMFEGQETWIAVQVFGKPVSDCPQISDALKNSIDANSARLDRMESDLQAMQAEMTILKRKKEIQAYNQMVNDYNVLVSEYNLLGADTKKMVADYNNQVAAFNTCASAQ